MNVYEMYELKNRVLSEEYTGHNPLVTKMSCKKLGVKRVCQRLATSDFQRKPIPFDMPEFLSREKYGTNPPQTLDTFISFFSENPIWQTMFFFQNCSLILECERRRLYLLRYIYNVY